MPEISRFERVTDKIFQRFEKLRNDPITPEIPIGFERVRKDVAAKRFQAMTPQQRMKFIEKVGVDEVIKIVGRG